VTRLAAKQQTSVVPLGRYITTHGPSIACLLNAARAIYGPPGIFNEKPCLSKTHSELSYNYLQPLGLPWLNLDATLS